jgi:hypothetical protein
MAQLFPAESEMMDLDLFVKLGWTALLGWNLRETVALGKRIVRIEAKLENGLFQELAEIRRVIERHIDGEEQRTLSALQRDPAMRTRCTDGRL